MSRPFQWCFLPVLWVTLAWPLSPAWSAQTIDLARIAQDMSITQQLRLLRDRTAPRLSPPDKADGQREEINAAIQQDAYRNAAFWRQGVPRNDAHPTVTRWPAPGSVRRQDVRLHLPEPDAPARPSNVMHWQSPHYAAMLYTLAPREQHGVMLQVADSSLIDLGEARRETTTFRQEEGREVALQTFVLGVSLVLVTYALIQGMVWRDRGFALMAMWIVTALVYILSFQGYPYLQLLPGGGSWLVRIPAALGCLATLLYLRMSYVLVGLENLSRWKRPYDFMSGLLAAATLWSALGDYRNSAPMANASAGFAYLVWLASMLDGWRHRLDNARLLVLSFAVAWLGMSLKMLELNGLVDRSILPDWYFSVLFQLGLLCVATAVVIGRALQLHRQYDQMQWAMLYMRVREQLKLEETVSHRTRELRAALQAADQANRAKSGFLTSISHDLRTPLTSILGFADMLQAAGGEHGRHGRIIVRSARHMLAMINDLIDYARGDSMDLPQPTPLYVHALLHNIGQEGAGLARRQRNDFQLTVAPVLPPVLSIDAPRLHRILGNLLDNAAKYTRDGSISLQVNWHPAAPASGMGVMEMQVSDTGNGIPRQYQERVFEPFERAEADRSQPGIGMGLAIVRQWIQQMGGQIILHSQPGQGTTMTLRLPVALASEQDITRDNSREGSGTLPLIDGTDRLLLLVEDSPDIAALLAEQLEMLGFGVEPYADGETAMARMARHGGPAPELVLTDYLLPDAHGGDVLRAARQHLPGVPVLLLSATLRPVEEPAEGMQFDASLLKPVNFMELQEALAHLLDLPLPPPASAPAPATTETIRPSLLPSPESLLHARKLIENGAVSDLLDWCEGLVQQHPQCTDFQARARQLLQGGDLSELEKLCDPVLAQQSAPVLRDHH